MATTEVAHASGRASERQKRLALLAAIVGTAIVMIDGTVVNVALPSIQADLGGGLSSQQWLVNAYLLTLSSLLLVGGSLGDVLGERRVFAAGVAGFGATSLLCALAPTIEVLVAARALQGAAGALLVPSALAVIVSTFPPDERGGAIGSWTAWSGMATIVGPVLGGWLVDVASWRLIFALNVPLVALALVLIATAVPAREVGSSTRRVDVVGAVLCALGLAGPTYGLIGQPAFGWGSPRVWAPIGGGLVLLAVFLAWERRAPDPMLRLELFRRRNFTVGNVETLLVYSSLGVALFFLVLFLQNVAGYTALESGLALLPLTLLMFTLSKRFGALADRYGPRLLMGPGPLLVAAGLALMLRVGPEVDYLTDLVPAMLLVGVGLSMTVAPLTAAVLSGVDDGDAGIASGVNNAVARVANLLGIAAVGVLVASQFGSALDDALASRPLPPSAQALVGEARARPLGRVDLSELSPAERGRLADAVEAASTDAFHAGIGIAALLAALGGVVGLAGIESPRRVVKARDCAGGALAPATAEALPRSAGAAV